jgi:hypothetical protein
MITKESRKMSDTLIQIDNNEHTYNIDHRTSKQSAAFNVSLLKNSLLHQKSLKKVGWITAAITSAASSLIFLGAAPSLAALASSCLRTSLVDRGFFDYLTVTNTCKTTQRYKVVIAFGTDIACTSISVGESQTWRWGYPRRFDRIESC